MADLFEVGQLVGLLERCKKGDRDAWEVLVRRFSALVYSVAKRSNLNDSDVEDVFQNTFIALHRSLKDLQDARALPKWIATTSARETWRIARLNRNHETLGDFEDTVRETDEPADALAHSAMEVESVHMALARIGEKCRELVTLLYIEEASYQEVCERMGMPIGAIGPTRSRCLGKIRRILEGMDGEAY